MVLGMKRKKKKRKIVTDEKKENEINSSNIQAQFYIKQTIKNECKYNFIN